MVFGYCLDELKTFFGRGGGEERDFEIDATRAFEIDLDKVGSAGGEDPDDAAAVFFVAHFLGEHGVDAAGDGGFAAAGIATAERLIGFVDEDVTFADGFDGAENFFEIALGAAIPFVSEVLEDDNGNIRFTGKATDEKRFAGADGAAEKIAHGDEIDLLLAPEGYVLAEMFLEGVLALNLIEIQARRKDFDQVGAFAFDELRFGAGEIGVVKRFALMFAELEEVNNAVQGGAGELTAGMGQFVFDFRKRGRSGGTQKEFFDIGGCGQGNVDLRGLAVVTEERVHIAAVLGEDKADDIVAGEERFAGPFANQKGKSIRIRIPVACEELRVLENNGDFEARLIGAGEGGEVGGVTEENGDEFDGGAGVFADRFGTILPAGEKIGPAFDPDAIPDIVGEDDVVAGHDALSDELRKSGKVFLI